MTTEKLDVAISVDIEGIEDDEKHACDLFFYSTNDIRKPPSSAPCFVLQLKKEEKRKVQLEVNSKPEFPYWCHVQVFVDNSKFDDDCELTELHRGCR